MFKGVVVDGSTSCIPGQFSAAASQEQGYEEPWEASAFKYWCFCMCDEPKHVVEPIHLC